MDDQLRHRANAEQLLATDGAAPPAPVLSPCLAVTTVRAGSRGCELAATARARSRSARRAATRGAQARETAAGGRAPGLPTATTMKPLVLLALLASG